MNLVAIPKFAFPLTLIVLVTGCTAMKPVGNGSCTPKRDGQCAAISNFGVVTPNVLWRGAQPVDGIAFDALYGAGVKTIVDLENDSWDRLLIHPKDCSLMKQAKAVHSKVNYIRIRSFEYHPNEENLVAFLKVVENPENWPVYVHCAQGENRTGAMVAGYRVFHDVPKQDAKAEMTTFHVASFWHRTNDEFIDSLDANKLREQLKNAKTAEPEQCE